MAFARQCDSCKRLIPPRGEVTPRYCPFCGSRLTGGPVEMPKRPSAPGQRVSGSAIAAFVFGLLAFVPGLGVLPAVLALAFGVAARGSIRRSAGALRGGPLATLGIVLAILGLIFHLGLYMRLV